MCVEYLANTCLTKVYLLLTTAVPYSKNIRKTFNPLNPELIPICYLLALLAHHCLHVSRIRVKIINP